ncbi:MAG TPA: MliC family protein [Casimicrobiaceae bacterium]|nr:MliC family protein [Casimicrobiaceae bacterium]
MTPMRRFALALAACATAAPLPALAVNANPHASAFVVLYRCDGGDWLAVGYPAPTGALGPPARVSWNGSTVLLAQARSGSGARYVNREADLEWRTKGREGTMFRLSDHSVLLANCREG